MVKDLLLMVLGMVIPGLLIYIFKLKRTDSKKDDAISEVLKALSTTKAEKTAEVSSARIEDANKRMEEELKAIEDIKLKGSSSPVAEAMAIAKELVKETSEVVGTQCIDVPDKDDEEAFFVPSVKQEEVPSTELPKDLKDLLSKQAKHMKDVFNTDDKEQENNEDNNHFGGTSSHRSFFR